MRDAGGSMAGRLHHHLDFVRGDHRRCIVGEARRRDAIVVPADAPTRIARAIRHEVGDRRDLDPRRGGYL